MERFTTDGEKKEKGGITWIYIMKLISSYYNKIKNKCEKYAKKIS